jgi:hypothetical protein
MTNIKRTLSVLLASSLLVTSSFETMIVSAASTESNDIEETIWIDNVEYSVSVDDDFNVVVHGTTPEKDSSADMILDTDLNGSLEITNGGEIEYYDVDIDTLDADITDSVIGNMVYSDKIEYTDIHATLTDEFNNVQEFSGVTSLMPDEYEGQMAITAAGGSIVVSGALTALIKAGIVVLASGTACYAVNKVVSTLKSKCKSYYYKAYVAANTVVIYPKPISRQTAISRIKYGLNVYTYLNSNAISVMNGTRLGYYGPEHHKKKYSIGYYFKHYHLNLHSKGRNAAHMFYGTPV